MADVNRLLTTAGEIRDDFSNRNLEMKNGGIQLLGGAEQARGRAFLQELSTYGIFAVPVGEPEYWLRHLGVTGHGSEWLTNIFERMGSDPQAAGYVRPAQGDVWDFVREVAQWISNPNRRGIPA